MFDSCGCALITNLVADTAINYPNREMSAKKIQIAHKKYSFKEFKSTQLKVYDYC